MVEVESEVVSELDWESLAFDGSVVDEVDAKCSLNGRVLRTVFQMIRSGRFKSNTAKNKAGKGRVGLSSSVHRTLGIAKPIFGRH
jgi:hypothetical protein